MALLSVKLGGESIVDSGSGVIRITQEWVSTYYSKEACAADARLPKKGTQHPNYQGVVVDSVAFGKESDGAITPTVLYSNDRSFEIVQNTRATISTKARPGQSIKQVQVYIPGFVLAEKMVPTGNVQSLTEFWDELPPGATHLTENRPFLTLTVIVPAITAQQQAQIISQINKVHLLTGPFGGNLKYEFYPPSSFPEDATRDRITYYWLHDPGTPATQSSNQVFAYPPVIPNSGGLMRKPFHRFIVRNGVGTDADEHPFPPTFYQEPFAFEELGGINYLDHWQILPGIVP